MAYSSQLSSPEFLAIRECYQLIVANVQHTVDSFCDSLHSKGLVPPPVYEFARNDSKLDSDKARGLIDAVLAKVEEESSAFKVFMEALAEIGPWSENIAKKIECCYKSECERHTGPDTHQQPATLGEFPFLDLSHLEESEKVDLKAKLKKDTRNMICSFSAFSIDIRESFDKQKLPLDKLKDTVLSLEAFTEDIGLKVLDEQDQQAIKEATNISQVFIILRNYISFFNYQILVYLIEIHGSESDHKKLGEYLQEFKTFCKRNIFEIPRDCFSTSNRPSAKMLVLKCTKRIATLENAQGMIECVAEVLGLQSSALQLRTIQKGCVELRMLVAAPVALHIKQVAKEKIVILASMSIRIIEKDNPQHTVEFVEFANNLPSLSTEEMVTPGKLPKRVRDALPNTAVILKGPSADTKPGSLQLGMDGIDQSHCLAGSFRHKPLENSNLSLPKRNPPKNVPLFIVDPPTDNSDVESEVFESPPYTPTEECKQICSSTLSPKLGLNHPIIGKKVSIESDDSGMLSYGSSCSSLYSQRSRETSGSNSLKSTSQPHISESDVVSPTLPTVPESAKDNCRSPVAVEPPRLITEVETSPGKSPRRVSVNEDALSNLLKAALRLKERAFLLASERGETDAPYFRRSTGYTTKGQKKERRSSHQAYFHSMVNIDQSPKKQDQKTSGSIMYDRKRKQSTSTSTLSSAIIKTTMSRKSQQTRRFSEAIQVMRRSQSDLPHVELYVLNLEDLKKLRRDYKPVLKLDFVDESREYTIEECVKDHLPKFVKFTDWSAIMAHLVQKNLLSLDDRQKLMSLPTHTEKGNYFYLDVLPSKGSDAYCRLYECIRDEPDHRGHKELLEILNNTFEDNK